MARIPGPFKRDVVLLEEGHELCCCAGVNVIAVLACLLSNFLTLSSQDDLKLRTAGRGDSVGEGDHAANMRFTDFCDIVLNHESIADGLDIDRHRAAVIGGGDS